MRGVSINAVTKLLIDVGSACDLYRNETLQKLKSKRIQCDEIWLLLREEKESAARTAKALDSEMEEVAKMEIKAVLDPDAVAKHNASSAFC